MLGKIWSSRSSRSSLRTPRLFFLRIAIFDASAGHLLADTSIDEEIAFLSFDEPMQQHICLMYENYSDIGHCLVTPYFHGLAIICRVGMCRTISACLESFPAVFMPQFQLAYTQIIFIIHQKLLQTGFCNVGQLYLGLFGCRPGSASFCDVLFAASGGLHHLVDCTIPFRKKTSCKYVCYVIDYFCDSKYSESAVITLLWNEFFH